jgi:hypothetical protein
VGRENSDDDDEERPAVSRPTVRPDFDPRLLAEQSEIRERATTITDEVALEAARVQSIPTKPPGPRASVADAEISTTAEDDDLSALSPEEQIAVLRDRLAPLGRVPHLAAKLDELGEDLQDPKAAFIIGFVDGLLPLETIIEVTGLPERDTLEVLDRLIEQGHVVFKKA